MKPIKSKFIEIKKVLNPIYITYLPVRKDVSQQQGMLIEKPDLPIYQISVIKGSDFSPISVDTMFSLVRDEISSNISKPMEFSVKQSYLEEILSFYSEVEERIVEDENGILTTDFYKFIKHSSQPELYFDEYVEFLKILKDNLRSEIQYVDNQIQQLEMKNTNPTSANRTSDADIIWKRKKNDLIELVRALKLVGAINNSTNDLTFDQAYKYFGDIFNLELKRPADQLRESSESYETLYFLEELLNIYTENQAILKKKRKSKSHPTSKQ